MTLIKVLLIALVLVMNFAIAQPSWADRGKFVKSPDYAEVTQAIADLLKTKDSPNQPATAEIQQKLANLQFQKYILETAEESSQCANQTGKTLAVYAQPEKTPASQPPTLYYLGDGQVTDDDFECKGIYLPTETTVSFSPTNSPEQALTEPLAIRIVNGTQLIATTNPDTGVVELNVPPMQTFKTGEGNWSIPTLTQTEIDAQPVNAPAD